MLITQTELKKIEMLIDDKIVRLERTLKQDLNDGAVKKYYRTELEEHKRLYAKVTGGEWDGSTRQI